MIVDPVWGNFTGKRNRGRRFLHSPWKKQEPGRK